MPLPAVLQKLRLPVIGAPMFIAGNPRLVIEQCKAGIGGSFPALNARPKEALEDWLSEIERALAGQPHAAPFAVKQICHKSNDRLEHDLEVCVRHKMPITSTSLRAPNDVIPRIHAYAGVVLHDVISVRHAEKALEAGVDGIILVCAGAGGHAGRLNPFALVNEIRRFFDGPLVLAGAITNGAAVLAAQAMGCDAAYLGTRFIATQESLAADRYKRMLVESNAEDIVYTPFFSGVHGSYLKPSIRAAGLDPDNLPVENDAKLTYRSRDERPKTWKDIWGAGQGVGNIHDV